MGNQPSAAAKLLRLRGRDGSPIRPSAGQPSVAVKVLRLQAGRPSRRFSDRVAREEPLEIRVRGKGVAVTMRTPGHDQELAVGFLLAEGLIQGRRDVVEIAHCGRGPATERANILNVFLAPSVQVDFERLTRHVFASSSCGLCGKATIESVHQHFPPVESELTVSAEELLRLPELLRAAQKTFAATGGLHAAAIFAASPPSVPPTSESAVSQTSKSASAKLPKLHRIDARRSQVAQTSESANPSPAKPLANRQYLPLLVSREDIGRHNAVDKVLGFGLLQNLLPFDRHVLLVSGRASFEIMQKALAARVPVVCAVSAPSSLAVEFARASGQTLIAFLRGDTMNIYSHPGRVTSAKPARSIPSLA